METPPFIGRTLGEDRFRVTERVAGTPWWGLYRGRVRATGAGCLVTTSTAPSDIDGLSKALDLEVPGVTALLFHGAVSAEEHPHYVVVEAEPDGVPLTAWSPRPVVPSLAAHLIGELAQVVARFHETAAEPLGGLHPHVIYAARRGESVGLTGCAPRHVRLLDRAGTEFKKPLFEPTFEAWDVLVGPRRVLASDVFALCAILTWLTTGIAPFGETLLEETFAHARGTPPLAVAPEPLSTLVTRGLSRDPDARPRLPELIEALGRMQS